MGTIVSRKRSNGTIGHTAQIRIKRDGQVVHSEVQTFDRKVAAQAWLKKRETELAAPGGLDKLKQQDPLLSEVIRQYLKESKRDYGKTKIQCLRTIQASDLGSLKCSEITSQRLLDFARGLQVQPQTVGNYLAHLSSVVTVARPAWGYPLDKSALMDARVVAHKLGLTARSNKRDRRPSLDELQRLLTHFGVIRCKRSDSIPMQDLVLFAIFSTRRQDEITRIVWEDLDQKNSEIIVRDMKNPGEKIGNDVRVSVPDRAMEIILRQPTRTGRIFVVNASTISTSFSRACHLLGIEGLTFHDLRHEGVSHLFELGKSIPQVAMVSGHRSWVSLKRYSHIRQSGDKYSGWMWVSAQTKS